MLGARREIIDAHILCRTLPHKCGFLLMTVLLQDLTQSNSSLPVTKDTVTVCQAIVVAFFINSFLKLSFEYVLARHLVAKLFFWPDAKLTCRPLIYCISYTHFHIL